MLLSGTEAVSTVWTLHNNSVLFNSCEGDDNDCDSLVMTARNVDRVSWFNSYDLHPLLGGGGEGV
jgi:hypothetical protein